MLLSVQEIFAVSKIDYACKIKVNYKFKAESNDSEEKTLSDSLELKIKKYCNGKCDKNSDFRISRESSTILIEAALDNLKCTELATANCTVYPGVVEKKVAEVTYNNKLYLKENCKFNNVELDKDTNSENDEKVCSNLNKLMINKSDEEIDKSLLCLDTAANFLKSKGVLKYEKSYEVYLTRAKAVKTQNECYDIISALVKATSQNEILEAVASFGSDRASSLERKFYSYMICADKFKSSSRSRNSGKMQSYAN